MMGEIVDNRQAVERVVQERAGWVFAAARRRVRDAALAEDVTQAVFLLYWRRRVGEERPGKVAGWLHRAVRYCSANALRLKQIQQRHEREAAMQKKERIETAEGMGAEWTEVEAELEGAMDRLSERDREVVLLRFYEQRPLAEVGKAMGISEEAARKRVDRAVGKLRGLLTKKGVRGTTAGLSAVLVGNVVGEMPEGLAEKIISAVGSGGGNTVAAAIAKGAMKVMTMAKVKVGAVVVGLAAAVVVLSQMPASSSAGGQSTRQPASQPIDRVRMDTKENRTICASRMRQIGQGLMLFSNSHNGEYPDTLGEMFLAEALQVQLALCPSTGAVCPAYFNNGWEEYRDQVEKWVNDNSNYTYLGKGMTNEAAPTKAILYEETQNHSGEGANVLFVDGHTDFVTPQRLAQLIQKTK